MVKRTKSADELEHELKLKDAEIESLNRQLQSYKDCLDALSWERRYIGAVSKTLCERLAAQEGEHEHSHVPG